MTEFGNKTNKEHQQLLEDSLDAAEVNSRAFEGRHVKAKKEYAIVCAVPEGLGKRIAKGNEEVEVARSAHQVVAAASDIISLETVEAPCTATMRNEQHHNLKQAVKACTALEDHQRLGHGTADSGHGTMDFGVWSSGFGKGIRNKQHHRPVVPSFCISDVSAFGADGLRTCS